MLLPLANNSVISFAASILRNCTKPSPESRNAADISAAASDSPSARTMLASFSCSAFATIYFARSVSCCAGKC
jgi:hypothetical protein